MKNNSIEADYTVLETTRTDKAKGSGNTNRKANNRHLIRSQFGLANDLVRSVESTRPGGKRRIRKWESLRRKR